MASEEQNAKKYFAHGKLLLTSEYFVLDGAKAVALPCKLGQTLVVTKNNADCISWKAQDHQQNTWFEAKIYPHHLYSQYETSDEVLTKVVELLRAIKKQHPAFIGNNFNCNLTFQLEFPRQWGLGTSSTFISLISQWSNTNPYQLLDATFGGSGYDLACAQSETAITYQLNGGIPTIEQISFHPPFSDYLYFVYLEKKQNSRSGIQLYKSKGIPDHKTLEAINLMSEHILRAKDLQTFEHLLRQHEQFISAYLGIETIQHQLFSDYFGVVKSLGAWGGDFVLVTSNQPAEQAQSYFAEKGFSTFIPFAQLVV